jgi:hypothetical protein
MKRNEMIFLVIDVFLCCLWCGDRKSFIVQVLSVSPWRLGDLETFRRACFNNTKLFELFDVVRAKYKSSNDRA